MRLILCFALLASLALAAANDGGSSKATASNKVASAGWQVKNKSPKSIVMTFAKGDQAFQFETLRTLSPVYDMDAALPATIQQASDKAKQESTAVPAKNTSIPESLLKDIPVKSQEAVAMAMSSGSGLVYAIFEAEVPPEWQTKLSKMSTTAIEPSLVSELKASFSAALASLTDMSREVALANNFMDQLLVAVNKKPEQNVQVASQKLKGVEKPTLPSNIAGTVASTAGTAAAAALLEEEVQQAGVRYFAHLHTGKAFNIAGHHSAMRIERRDNQNNGFLSIVDFCNHGRCPFDNGMNFKCTRRGGVNPYGANQPPNWMCAGGYWPLWCPAFLGRHNCNGDAMYQLAVVANPANPPANNQCAGNCPATSPAC